MAHAMPVHRRPDFSGEWTLNAQRSKLGLEQLRGLESAIVRVDHRDPHFQLWRKFVLRGEAHIVDLGLDARGQAIESRVGKQRRVSCLTWEEDTLVFTTHMYASGGVSTNIVRYTLEQDGEVLQARESFRGPALSYENFWVFERVSGPTE
ncbi:MAG: hypothetical protein ACRENH_03500 [Gemmatimonadaceae bacterium]